MMIMIMNDDKNDDDDDSRLTVKTVETIQSCNQKHFLFDPREREFIIISTVEVEDTNLELIF